MLQLLYTCVASVCSKCFIYFFRYMLQVYFFGYCICFTVLQVFYLDIAYALQWPFKYFFKCFYKCFICMFQVFNLSLDVCYKCFICMFQKQIGCRLCCNGVSGWRTTAGRLSYESYFFNEGTLFFSHNKSTNSTFQLVFSTKRTRSAPTSCGMPRPLLSSPFPFFPPSRRSNLSSAGKPYSTSMRLPVEVLALGGPMAARCPCGGPGAS
jgi:hypothetical protein